MRVFVYIKWKMRKCSITRNCMIIYLSCWWLFKIIMSKDSGSAQIINAVFINVSRWLYFNIILSYLLLAFIYSNSHDFYIHNHGFLVCFLVCLSWMSDDSLDNKNSHHTLMFWNICLSFFQHCKVHLRY